MKCLKCGNEFIIPRNFATLFKIQKVYVCDKCVKDNPIKISFNYIPLTNHQLEIISLFDKPYGEYDAFINEYSQIYQAIVNRKKASPIYLYDSFHINEKKIEEFDYLAKELNQDIIILANTYLT